VDSTAHVASTILEDVKKSSESMDQTVTNCLDDFSGYLNHQGDILKEELITHFDSMQSFLSTQAEDVSKIVQKNQSFADRSQENIVRATGSTPEKKQMRPLKEIR
jgi:hypothetical protein